MIFDKQHNNSGRGGTVEDYRSCEANEERDRGIPDKDWAYCLKSVSAFSVSDSLVSL